VSAVWRTQTADQLKLEREIMLTLRSIATLAFCLSALALGGCETTTAGGAVGANRSQLMLVSSEQMDEMSAQGYTKLKADASSKGALNKDTAMLQRVRTIAGRLEPQTKIFRPDAPGWKWEVNVITSNELNAFCMPGGKIMVYSGLINQLKLTDDEIAIVLGHEIAHALREHSRNHVSQAMVRPILPAPVTRPWSPPGSAVPTKPKPTKSAWNSRHAPATTRAPESRCGRK
jgi:Zn-dependent protease with chaperone function